MSLGLATVTAVRSDGAEGGARLLDVESQTAFGPTFPTLAEAEAFLRWYRDDVLTDGIGWLDESEAPPESLRELTEVELEGLKHVWDVNRGELLPFFD